MPMNDTDNTQEERKQNEINYYRNQINELSGSIIKLQYQNTQMSHETRQMRSGLDLISGLKNFSSSIASINQVYAHFIEEIVIKMQLDKAMVLQRSSGKPYHPTFIKGYSKEDTERLKKTALNFPKSMEFDFHSILVNSKTESDAFIETIRKHLSIEYFILSPIVFDNQVFSYLLVGRKSEEEMLASSQLMPHDKDTLEAISGIISTLKYQLEQNIVLERKVAVRTHELNIEKKKSDDLLLNILPVEIAEELKSNGKAEAKYFEQVTVLFTDIVGFTQLSEKLSPQELVAEINECFTAFDHIMQKQGVEKIKTIGDAYMAAGGLPTINKTHAEDVVNAALDIQQFMFEHKAKKKAAGELFFEIRVGVHTGPVVAGIVGVKKFAYDIWGGTVNIASRMESSGEPGKVNISGATFELLKDKFSFTYRGKIQAKGKGEIDMYFANRSTGKA